VSFFPCDTQCHKKKIEIKKKKDLIFMLGNVLGAGSSGSLPTLTQQNNGPGFGLP
jgi:hypothetical protein